VAEVPQAAELALDPPVAQVHVADTPIRLRAMLVVERYLAQGRRLLMAADTPAALLCPTHLAEDPPHEASYHTPSLLQHWHSSLVFGSTARCTRTHTTANTTGTKMVATGLQMSPVYVSDIVSVAATQMTTRPFSTRLSVMEQAHP